MTGFFGRPGHSARRRKPDGVLRRPPPDRFLYPPAVVSYVRRPPSRRRGRSNERNNEPPRARGGREVLEPRHAGVGHHEPGRHVRGRVSGQGLRRGWRRDIRHTRRSHRRAHRVCAVRRRGRAQRHGRDRRVRGPRGPGGVRHGHDEAVPQGRVQGRGVGARQEGEEHGGLRRRQAHRRGDPQVGQRPRQRGAQIGGGAGVHLDWCADHSKPLEGFS